MTAVAGRYHRGRGIGGGRAGSPTLRRMPPRAVFAVAAGAAVAALGAVILGEYPFSGLVVVGAGVLLGLFVAEAVVAAGGARGRGPAAASAVLALAGLVWAAWIAENHDLGGVDPEGWLAVASGGAAAALRAKTLPAAAGSRPEPAPGRGTGPASPEA